MSVLVAVRDHKGDLFIGSDLLVTKHEYENFPMSMPTKSGSKWPVVQDEFALGAAGAGSVIADLSGFEPDLNQDVPAISRAVREYLVGHCEFDGVPDKGQRAWLDVSLIVVHRGEIWTVCPRGGAFVSSSLPEIKRETVCAAIGHGCEVAMGAMWGTAKYAPDGVFIVNAGIVAAGHFLNTCDGIWNHKMGSPVDGS